MQENHNGHHEHNAKQRTLARTPTADVSLAILRVLRGSFILSVVFVVSVVVPVMAQPMKTSHLDAPDFTAYPTENGVMRDILERFQSDQSSLERKYPLALSARRRERFARFWGEWQTALDKMNYEALPQTDKFDWQLFRNYLNHAQRTSELKAEEQKETQPLMPFAEKVLELEEARRAMQWAKPEDSARKLAALIKQIAQIQEQFEKQVAAGKMPAKPTVANRAAGAVRELKETLERWHGFYAGYDPLFTWWCDEPYKKTSAALEAYAVFLREKVAGVKPGDTFAIVGNPIGREALLAELQNEMISYTPEQLIALAKKEFDWCEREAKKAAQELGFGDDWHKALEHVKTLHVAPGEQPQKIKELAEEAIAFLDKHELVTVPPLVRETWRMEMMPPDRQRVNPYFLGGEVIQVSFPTHSMTQDEKLMSLRSNNLHFARATVHHELVPGHHLQLFMAERYRPYRRLFDTPFFVEGWALHWELLLWDKGFARNAADRVGMLFWRMHRCARIIFSLGFHTEQMTAQECIRLLIDRVGHEPASAEAEVRRSLSGDYPPLYQAAYLLGGLQISALRRELVETGKMTDRAFHDALLKQNSIPVEIVRAALTNQTLPKNFTPQWKFYGELK
jgi:uncharacterized protein (DUF885 family)